MAHSQTNSTSEVPKARTHGLSLTRGRFDDLVYEPDPLGRVGKGRWLRRGDPSSPVADNPDGAVERLREAWRGGAMDTAGDLFDLDASVGLRGRNHKLDVAKVEFLLAAAGAFDLAPTDGPTGNFSDRRAHAIRDFQHVNELKPDGMIEPGGETHRALLLVAAPSLSLPRPSSLRQTLVPAPGKPPVPPLQSPASGTIPGPAKRRPRPPPPSLVSPTTVFDIRRRDAEGEGHYGARREGGARKHEGLDISANSGESITSTVDGKVTKIGYAYQTKKNKKPRPGDFGQPKPFRYIEVTTPNGFTVRHLYVAPDSKITIGSRVKAGRTRLGTSQDLWRRYPAINNHVHIEVRDPLRGNKTYDPAPLFSDLADDF